MKEYVCDMCIEPACTANELIEKIMRRFKNETTDTVMYMNSMYDLQEFLRGLLDRVCTKALLYTVSVEKYLTEEEEEELAKRATRAELIQAILEHADLSLALEVGTEIMFEELGWEEALTYLK